MQVELISLKALSYLGIRSDKLNDWTSFAGGLLGMQKIDKSGKSMAFRMDSQEQRLLVSDEPGETLAFMGLEVGARDDLETLAAKLDAAGTPVHIGSRELADRRLVQDLIWFLDPMGNRNELVYKPMLARVIEGKFGRGSKSQNCDFMAKPCDRSCIIENPSP